MHRKLDIDQYSDVLANALKPKLSDQTRSSRDTLDLAAKEWDRIVPRIETIGRLTREQKAAINKRQMAYSWLKEIHGWLDQTAHVAEHLINWQRAEDTFTHLMNYLDVKPPQVTPPPAPPKQKLQNNGSPPYRSITTFAGRASFDYSGSATTGVTMVVGASGSPIKVSAALIQELLTKFGGRGEVLAGTSLDNPPAGSVGEWIALKTSQNCASWILGVLIAEGFAKRTGRGRVELKRLPES